MNKGSLLIILVLFCISCDGKHRFHMAPEDNLREANLMESFSEQWLFIPEQPTEIITDTLMSSGFHIKITYHSQEDRYVSKTKKTDQGTLIKTYHKNFEAEFLVKKNKELIAHGILNKAFFSNIEDVAFWQDAIMQYVWVDQPASLTEHSIQLKISFNKPDTNQFKDYVVIIFDNGDIEIEDRSVI